MPQPLAGKIALITGASSGIGEAAAVALAAAGATVAVAARRADRLHALVARIEAAGGKALALPGDVTDEAVAKAIVAETLETFGRLDILVNSAGVASPGRVENADIAEWRRAMDINMFGTLHTCAAVIGPMRAQGGGDIINISSLASYKSNPVFNPYAASKFALRAMSDGMRQEVGGFGIRVCVIMPGATTTEVAESIADPNVRDFMRKHVGKEGAMLPEDVAAAVLLAVTLPPRATVSELMIRPTIDTSP